MTSNRDDAILRLRVVGLTKRFGATQALSGGAIECRSGEVVGLVGENGAGKSTMIKVLNGMVSPDGGSVELDGMAVTLTGPRRALALGIATVFQELSLIPEMSVAENLLLGREVRSFGAVDGAASGRRAAEILKEWGCAGIEPGAAVKSLSLAQQQQVEIVRALSRSPRVLLLDEPTSALTESEVDWLFQQIQRVREAGTAVVLISHRIAEVKNACDRITVLRSGATVTTHAADVPDARIVADMLGRELADEFAEPRVAATSGPPSLELRAIRLRPYADPIDLTLHEGEIVGVAGLEGQGQAELFTTVFGMASPSAGEIVAGGTGLRPGRIGDAIAAGVGLVPESRKDEGLFLDMSVLQNSTIASLRQFSRFGFMRTRREREAVLSRLHSLRVEARRLRSVVSELSGGNQQRVVFAKWLLRGSRILLLFDPTRGVDVGAKVGIFDMLREHVGAGGSVLLFSSELDELLAMSDRIVVMYNAGIHSELAPADFDKTTILNAMLGREGVEGA